MNNDLEKLMRDYTLRYTQQVRDVVETFSSSTTRLGNVRGTPAMSEVGVRAIALKHDIDAEALISAVIDYAEIEALSEQALRKSIAGVRPGSR
ncbi:MAG: hypothetical protein JWQ73_3505 [Variovorax sp.]|nr:hypothetical protein [Variovorax sp.]